MSQAGPPPSYTSNQWRQWHPAAYQSGRDNTDPERNNLLPQTTSYGSAPLPIRPKTSQSGTSRSIMIGLIILVLIINLTTIFYPPVARESIRREWESEQRRHQMLRDSWTSEENTMQAEREAWAKERINHRLEREELAAEKETWRKERAGQQSRDREELAAEKERWRNQQSRDREEFAVEKERWRKKRADQQSRDREELAAEKERWRKERADQRDRERDEEEAKRALIVWQDLKPSPRCLRYGTREYSATLAQVPIGLDPLDECRNKSIDIHGRQVLPSRCDNQGACGAVVGHWVVDFNEATCVTWWRGYDDKGCVERGIHRYESILENLQNGDDWHEMCATTPGHVQGKDFAGPTSCASWRSGINAIWLVEDENCY